MNWLQDSTLLQFSNSNCAPTITNENNFFDDEENPLNTLFDDGFWNGGTSTEEEPFSYSLFSTTKFVRINCDKFYEDNSEKGTTYVQLKNPLP